MPEVIFIDIEITGKNTNIEIQETVTAEQIGSQWEIKNKKGHSELGTTKRGAIRNYVNSRIPNKEAKRA
jgi:hypothetical protein